MRNEFKIIAAMFITSGCNLPPINVSPTPHKDRQPTEHTIKITIDGEGKINVGGDATITAKPAAVPTQPASVCDCGCGKDRCTCSRGPSSAATTASTSAGSGPQFITQYVRQQVCENGVCRIISVPVQVPLAETSRTATAKVKVYTNGSPACEAMKRELRYAKGIDFDRGTPPPINGVIWWPTAVSANGAIWSPASGGWHAKSRSHFEQWRGGI